MLTEVFYWLLNMSITGTIAGFAVLLIRAVPRIPRRVIFVLWLIPLVRFWFPALLVSKYSLLTWFLLSNSRTVPLPGQEVEVFQLMNMGGAAVSYFPVTFRLDLLDTVFLTASITWAVIMALILAYLTAAYISGLRIAGNAEPLLGRVYLSPMVDSPAVYGIFRPRILIPNSNRDRDLGWTLRHEEAHIRRLDNLWRLLALVTAAVHWFNPFAWLFLRLFFADLEQACDETVLASRTEEEKKEYAAALLNHYESRSVLASPFGGGNLRSRIEKIMTYRKMSVFSAVCMTVFAAALAYVLLTNPI